MRIDLASVMVDDQAKALAFYTEVLGFVKKTDVPVGEFRWLTVVSPEAREGVELLLEPNQHPAARAFQEATYADGIPAASFGVSYLEAEYERLKDRVAFRTPPTKVDWGSFAVFDDTCGNLINLREV